MVVGVTGICVVAGICVVRIDGICVRGRGSWVMCGGGT